jgi:penicillin-insensitive murein endopeptidase
MAADGASTRAGANDEDDGTLEAADEDDDGTPYDEVEDEPESGAQGSQRAPHPLDAVSQDEIERRLRSDRRSLGSMSIGLPNSGRLINAVQLPESPYWERVAPYAAWATSETVDYLTAALAKVRAQYPDSGKLFVGDISAERGGYLAPHLSHQSGRDVDIGFFYRKDAGWYRRANIDNLDRERTWAFVRALITDTDVRFILIDRSLQPLLREYAESIGEDRAWLDAVFRGTGTLRGAVIRHAPGHATHIHIRFDAPVAQETARLCYAALLKAQLVEPPSYFITHKVKKGETLGKIAKRYGTTIPALKKINGLKNSLIRAGRVYKIPRKGNAPPPPPTARLPRLLPPTSPKPPAAAPSTAPSAPRSASQRSNSLSSTP